MRELVLNTTVYRVVGGWRVVQVHSEVELGSLIRQPGAHICFFLQLNH